MKYTKMMLRKVGTMSTKKKRQVILLRAMGPATRRIMSAR